MGKKYAVIGGGGSFGQHTCKYLLEQPDTEQVIAIGRNVPKTEPFTLNIGKGDNKYSYHAYHVTHELDFILDVLDRNEVETIVNYAAQGEGAISWKNSWRFFETNSMALARLTEELQKREYFKRFIQIGTSELYGSVTEAANEQSPILPSSPYSASKAAFDLHLIAIHKVLGFPMNIIRPSNAYCPGQLLHRVIPRAILCALKGEKIPLHGGGKAEKSYIHAGDLAKAIHLVSEKAAFGKVYNVGPDKPISIRDLLELVAKVMNMPFEGLCTITGERMGQDSRYWLNSSAIKNDLGWQQEIPLEEGIIDMVDWAKMYIDQLKSIPYEYTMRA